MSRGQQNRNQQGSRRRRRDWEATPSVRRPSQFYGDESRRVVYVAAEGERTERDYVALLNSAYGDREKFFLNFSVTRKGLRPTEVVDLVLASASAPDDEKWALFDRDAPDNRDQDIPEAMRDAAKYGVQVALSHPSFELWLLLHFQQFGGAQGAAKNTHVLEKLRKADPAYKRFDKPDKGLGAARTKALKGKEKAAVQHARALVGQCEHGSCKPANATFEAPKYGRVQPGSGLPCFNGRSPSSARSSRA